MFSSTSQKKISLYKRVLLMKWFTDIVGCDILALAKAISFPNIVRWVEFNIGETIYVAKAKCLLANSYSSCWVYLDVSVKPGASFS